MAAVGAARHVTGGGVEAATARCRRRMQQGGGGDDVVGAAETKRAACSLQQRKPLALPPRPGQVRWGLSTQTGLGRANNRAVSLWLQRLDDGKPRYLRFSVIIMS
jgi:hypothetical protein